MSLALGTRRRNPLQELAPKPIRPEPRAGALRLAALPVHRNRVPPSVATQPQATRRFRAASFTRPSDVTRSSSVTRPSNLS
jgi:hypothetical protein